ncbi:MAG TPA: methylmalonyl-CoA epimerase [Actinomycetota bacterium]|nr:methylmalonyl-CoA epimerase [Actinomycetota bacterium]
MELDHIAIAVPDMEAALAAFKELYGLEPDRIETVETEKITEAMLPVGNTHLQLLEATDPSSTVARFIEKRGGGLHHIAVRVDDLEGTMARIRDAGGQLLDDEPRPGGGGHRVAFVHPRSNAGVLVELVEGAHGSH